MTKLENFMENIDLNYKPTSYFLLKKFGLLLGDIKGAERRIEVANSLESGKTDLDPILLKPKLSESERSYLGSIHPSFMGGEYLPDTEINEIEIARITIASTTQDVTCVYVKEEDGLLLYRIVDEYGGDTLDGPNELVSTEPLSLENLINFFLNGWDLFCCLDANFSDYNFDPCLVKGFIVDASSNFYSQFGQLLDKRIDEWLSAIRRIEDVSEEGYEED
jgi:hypothetical protein